MTACSSEFPRSKSIARWLVLLAAASSLALPACSSGDGPGPGAVTPTLTIVSPSDGQTIVGSTEVVVRAEPDAPELGVVVSGDATRTARDGGEFRFAWRPDGGAGDYLIRATASLAGVSANASVGVSFAPDYLPALRYCPSACAPAPRELDVAAVPNALVDLRIEVDPRLRQDRAVVTWTLDERPLGGLDRYPWTVLVDTAALDDGRHVLRWDFAPALGTGGSGGIVLVASRCDFDGDGFVAVECGGDDCRDRDAAINPDTVELCDGRSNDCDDAIDEGAVCDGGRVCVDGACVAGVCEAQGAACGAASSSTWPFTCDLGSSTCRRRCALDHPIPERACPEGHACRPAPDRDGWCVRPGCSNSAGCDEGEVCAPFDFGFGECVVRGAAAVGEACRVPDRLDDPLPADCAEGLECFGGTCVETCDPAAGGCAAGRACVRVWDTVRDAAAGICLAPCDSYATTGCRDGFSCQPIADLAFSQTTSWACVPAAAGVVAAGAECRPGIDVCESGFHCAAVAGFGTLVASEAAAPTRCVRACNVAVFGWDCGAGRRCVLTPGSPRGTCVEECDPFPRASTGYGCDAPDSTCHPLLGGGGACVPASPELGPGDACAPDRSFGGCADGGYCVDLRPGGTAPSCHVLCDPFADEPGCVDGEVCNPRPLLDGHGGIGVCDPAPTARSVGSPCDAPGRACAERGTICVDTGEGPRCRRACAGPEDCAGGRCLWSATPAGLLVRGQAGVCE